MQLWGPCDYSAICWEFADQILLMIPILVTSILSAASFSHSDTTPLCHLASDGEGFLQYLLQLHEGRW